MESTMTKLAVFSFGNQEIRTATDEHGEIWFVANDVCAAMGLGNPNQALSSHVSGDCRKLGKLADSNNRAQETNFLSERGVLQLLVKSRKTQDKFVDEVISKVHDAKAIIAALEDFEVPEDLPPMYVYAIRNKTTRRIKLGISQNPERRLKELQIGNDCELELVAFRKAENRFKDEKALHRENAPYCVRSEWFDDEISFDGKAITTDTAATAQYDEIAF
jgi:hypothetical protein